MCYEEEYIVEAAEEAPRRLFPATSALSPVTRHNRVNPQVNCNENFMMPCFHPSTKTVAMTFSSKR
jgi:hypothetical protein